MFYLFLADDWSYTQKVIQLVNVNTFQKNESQEKNI